MTICQHGHIVKGQRRSLEDPAAEAKSLLRVIDESGEDYLFPADLFVPIEVPQKAELAFAVEGSGAR